MGRKSERDKNPNEDLEAATQAVVMVLALESHQLAST
jgi:hypothetical protein